MFTVSYTFTTTIYNTNASPGVPAEGGLQEGERTANNTVFAERKEK